MNRFILSLLFIFILNIGFGQDAKQKLGFIPYSDPKSENAQYRKMAYDYLYEAAVRIFINTQRFDVLDRSKFDILKLERNYTKGDDFINSEIVKQGNALAAEVLAVAKITALSLTEAEDGSGWSAFFTVEFKQIDVETTKAINALQLKGEMQHDLKQITIKGNAIPLTKTAKSPQQAISIVVSAMEETLQEWINNNFPLKMKIDSWDEDNRIIYAIGGKNIGLMPGDRMALRKIRRLSTGEPIAETVAELKFTKEDGIGEVATKFKPKKKKDWDKIVDVLEENEGRVFIMKSARKPPIWERVLKK
ncbi:MAG: hypothetical protein AAF798_17120 [Bacteroidota bacterium]